MGKAMTERWLAELRGSRAWTEAEGRRVVDAWEASGELVTTFARKVGLVPQRVYWWRDRLGRRPAAAPVQEAQEGSVPAFLPVTIRMAPTLPGSAAVTICTPEGLRVEVTALDATSAAWVATLVRSLAEQAS
jgi:transposase-like protein